MKKVFVAIAILALAACSQTHTVGAGNPSLGVVSITGPSSVNPTSGALTVGEAGVLIGAPFIGPTIPDAVPPGTPGTLTVTFTSEDTQHVKVNLKFRAGVYDFDFTTSNITGSLQNAVIDYDGGHAGDYGSCIKWTSSNVVFTQGIDVDKLDGNWMGDCHHSDLARAGDRGVFHLTRKGTLVAPQCPAGTHGVYPNCVPDAPPPPPVCSGMILGGLEVRQGNDWIPQVGILDHNDEHLRFGVTLTPPGCAPPTVTITTVSDPDHPWITHVEYAAGYVTFDTVGNSSKTDTRAGSINVNGQVVGVLQDHK
jgi:hypothetical protein